MITETVKATPVPVLPTVSAPVPVLARFAAPVPGPVGRFKFLEVVSVYKIFG